MIRAFLSRLRAGGAPPATRMPDPAEDVLGAASLPPSADARFAQCVREVLKHEGGYVDHPRDPGGCTNRGITRATLESWRGVPTDCAAVRALTEAEARAIYRARYWDAVRGDDLPPGVDLAVFDLAVNSGVGRAARMLQQALGVEADGAIGPRTMVALADADAIGLVGAMCARRLVFLKTLPTWPIFGLGWERRVVDVRAKAVAMARGGSDGRA